MRVCVYVCVRVCVCVCVGVGVGVCVWVGWLVKHTRLMLDRMQCRMQGLDTYCNVEWGSHLATLTISFDHHLMSLVKHRDYMWMYVCETL